VVNDKRSHWWRMPWVQVLNGMQTLLRIGKRVYSWLQLKEQTLTTLVFRCLPAPGDRGTGQARIEYAPPGGVVASAVAKLFGEEPQQQIGDATPL